MEKKPNNLNGASGIQVRPNPHRYVAAMQRLILAKKSLDFVWGAAGSEQIAMQLKAASDNLVSAMKIIDELQTKIDALRANV